MKNVTIIPKRGHRLITLTHDDTDPGSWIVRRWKTLLGFEKLISNNWFNDTAQAAASAAGFIRES